ncbi:hypothetical protein [uncultured Winogradskyella sp.]|uniref:hypothetical protein n=1 Tax=uncultured Winogradskyella sp. TaxID=395353 RepID=UPI002631D982|nr:hypothetical protein [uncultured Winogradskyella sp.]
MKTKIKYIYSIALMLCAFNMEAQQAIGTNNPDPSSALDISSTTAGILIPRMTTAQRTAIVAPAEGLEVYDTDTKGRWFFDGTQWVQNTSAGDTTDDAWVNNPANTSIELGTLSDGTTARPTGAEFVALDNGNVGIGTMNPIAKLQVGDDPGSISGTIGSSVVFSENAGGWASWIENRGTGAFNSGQVITAGSPSTNFGYITLLRNQDLDEVFAVKPNGNVGIGTNAPSETLEVVGSLKTKVQLAPNHYAGFYSGDFPLDLTSPSPANVMYSHNQEIWDGTGPIAFFNTTPGEVRASAHTNGTSIGLGPNSSNSGGQFFLRANFGANLTYFSENTSFNSGFGVNQDGITISSVDFSNTPNNLSNIHVEPNSGIVFGYRRGTANETYEFPSDNGNANEVLTTDGAGQLTWEDPSTSAINVEPWFGTDDNMGATTNTEDIYTLGNVGIGLSNPSSKLQIGGSQLSTGETVDTMEEFRLALHSEDAGNTFQAARTSGFSVRNSGTGVGSNGSNLGLHTPYLFEFFNSGSATPFVVMNADTGNVGIGTPTPNEKLEVAGNVYASGGGALLTDTGVYADYVFEDYVDGTSKLNTSYKFKTLEEVDAFILNNKHLPGVTGIKELEKTEDGYYRVNISALSGQLLEKVEELFLHTIAQQKELKAKEAKINELEARLKRIEELLTSQKQ